MVPIHSPGWGSIGFHRTGGGGYRHGCFVRGFGKNAAAVARPLESRQGVASPMSELREPVAGGWDVTETLVAGVDSSTQSTKVLIVDADTGAVVASGQAPHRVTGEGGARESDPAEWRAALASALAATGRAQEIRAISVAGQQHGLVVLGDDGEPLRPAILWNDTRPSVDADRLVAAQGAQWWVDRTGSVPVAAFTVAKWAWLRRNEPAVAAATRAIRLPHDFLTEALTGAPATDRGDASGTGWWSPRTGEYEQEILALPGVDIDPGLLPPVLAPDAVAGHVTASAAERFGIPVGIPVGVGTGDNMAAALALGAAPGTPVLSLGTSGTVYVVSEAPSADISAAVAGFADATGHFLPLVCVLNSTLVVDRVAQWFGLDRDDVLPSGEVSMLPYFDGERTPNLPDAAGSINGLRHGTDPRQILQAAYDGIVGGLLSGMDAMVVAGAVVRPDAPLFVVGGGAKGRTWLETAARLSGRATQTSHVAELVALGAAAQAAAVLGNEHPFDVATRWASIRSASPG